jgi:hypothetical protein
MMAMDPTKPWQDAIDPRYEQLGPYGSLEQAMAYGVAPVNGMIARGQTMPGTGVDHSTGKMYEPGFTKGGQWQYIGQQDTGMRNPEHGPASQGQWQFVEQQAPQAQAPMPPPEEKQPEQPADPSGKTIYNDWDTYRNKARADVEGINRMPFTFSDYAGVALDKNDAMQQFYPGAYQEGGVQKIIGPNGQNIAPRLQDDGMLDAFRYSGLDTAKVENWPSLVKMLQSSGLLSQDAKENAAQQQVLLDLAKPKKPDMSFSNQMLMGQK